MTPFFVFKKLNLKSSPSFNPKLVALIMISKFFISFSRFSQGKIFKKLNFFLKYTFFVSSICYRNFLLRIFVKIRLQRAKHLQHRLPRHLCLYNYLSLLNKQPVNQIHQYSHLLPFPHLIRSC